MYAEKRREGGKRPGEVLGLQRDHVESHEGYRMVFELIRMRAKEIGALLGFHDEDSDEVKKLAAMDPDDVFLSFSPIDVIKYGRSLMAPLFVGLVCLATNRKVKPMTVITGELGLW